MAFASSVMSVESTQVTLEDAYSSPSLEIDFVGVWIARLCGKLHLLRAKQVHGNPLVEAAGIEL